jgi:hypothetical protein
MDAVCDMERRVRCLLSTERQQRGRGQSSLITEGQLVFGVGGFSLLVGRGCNAAEHPPAYGSTHSR